jgi:hypothetical protein
VTFFIRRLLALSSQKKGISYIWWWSGALSNLV